MNGVDELEVPTERFLTGQSLLDLARDPEVHLALVNGNKRLI
jgi:hypothetical protein